MNIAEYAVSIYGDVLTYAVPFAVVWSIGNLICDTFLRVAFGGKLYFGRGGGH